MATESPFIHDGGQTTAAANLSAKQFYVVKLTAARAVNVIAAQTDAVYGVLQNKPSSGQVADVALFGVCKVQAGQTFAAAAKLMSNTSGQAIVFATGGSNTLLGYSLEASTSTTQIVTAFIFPAINSVAN